MKQEQFLDVVSEAEAHERFDAACAHVLPQTERVPLDRALSRVLAEDVRAPVDVPGFDRSNVDGFAVRAADTFGAEELEPVRLVHDAVAIAAGVAPPPDFELAPGHAATIATGGALPRGADAVVMVEYTLLDDGHVVIQRAVAPGGAVTWAGTDLGVGDLVLPRGTTLSAHECGMLAAVGVAAVNVVRRPRVAVLSTGDEIRAPGEPLRVGDVYDANGRILADAVTELGAQALACGIVPDDEALLEAALREQLRVADVVLLSGGTSKGAGDLNYRVVERLAAELPKSPGIVVHGVALKPGKPVCLAVVAGRPVIVLPGFPTSAIFTFHEFVAPLLRRLGGRPGERAGFVHAVAPLRIESVVGRTHYTLVGLLDGADGLAAYPLGAGSGSVSAFARADGFVRIPHDEEYVASGTRLAVRLLGREVRPAALVAVGSHCIGLDALLGLVGAQGHRTKSVVVGSQGGLHALARGEGHVAGVHLLDEESGVYNTPFLPDGVTVLGGYGRRQGVVFRRDDPRFAADASPINLVRTANAAGARMVNRNAGSGTRVLVDALLRDAEGHRPDGYQAQARSHNAVAAAVAQGRADWGVTLDVLATANGLGFAFLREERYELVARDAVIDDPAVVALRAALTGDAGRAVLQGMGFVV